MADRTSAALFADIITSVLDPATVLDPREFVITLLDRAREYDFSFRQMGIDDLLLQHDLARRIPTRWTGEFEIVYYGDPDFGDDKRPARDPQ